MPELPEVEYTARQLRTAVVGASIQEVCVFWERTIAHPRLAEFLAEVADRRIEAVRRRGKLLLFDLSGGLFLSLHRRMTGNVLLLPQGWEIDTHLREQDAAMWATKGPSFYTTSEATPSREAALLSHCRVSFYLTDGRRLLFTDPRKFGRIELWPQEREREVLADLGPEPLSQEFTVDVLQRACMQRKKAIKNVLLDQSVVAGIGNIYADEALFAAKIHPLRQANRLSAAEVGVLHESIIAVLMAGIEHGGTSFHDYRDLWGEAGSNYHHVQVYQQDGTPCPRCGHAIERMVVAQRSTHVCPTCQVLTLE